MTNTRCEGCIFATKCIGTRGPVDSPFVIIGESPGAHELKQGKPFAGPSGKMLASILRELGCETEPYIVNAIQCMPQNKDMQKLERATKACRNRVVDLIGAHPRKVILALGLAAAWSATGDYTIRILSARGSVRSSPLASDGIMLTLHPAYLMRNGSAYSSWKKDISGALKLLEKGSGIKWKKPSWSVVSSSKEYQSLVDEYHNAPLITGDVETDTLHWMDGRMLCLGITKDDGTHVDIIPEHLLYNAHKTTKHLLEGGIWNWQNGLFDIKWFRKLGINAKVDHDTLLMSYTLNENRGYHDLDQIAQYHIGAPPHKGMLEKHLPHKGASYRYIPKEILYEYNAIDLSKTHCVVDPMLELIGEDEHDTKLYTKTLIPAVEFLANMQKQGVLADISKIKDNLRIHDEDLQAIRDKVQPYSETHLGRAINLNAPKQVAELIYTKMELGNASAGTSEKVLIDVKRKTEHPIVDLILDHREVAKRKGTYVANILPNLERKKNPAGFVKSDGRIHADFKLHGTSTGRLAGAEPNLLNQPRNADIRSQYVAAPGKIFVEVDLNQAELRSLALMSGDPILMDIYTKNEVSIHDITTGEFYAPKQQIMSDPLVCKRVMKQLMMFHEVDPATVYKEAKMRGKAVNFGIVYGRTSFSLAREFNITIKEAERWISEWLQLYQGAADFISYCRQCAREGKTLITNFGRKKRHGVVSPQNILALQNEAANFPHQSTASDIMLQVAIEVQPVLASKWHAYIWNEVYDAIYYEVDDDNDVVAETIEYVQGVVKRIPRDWGLTKIPFLGDAKVGYKWGTMEDWKGSINESLGIR